MIIVMYAVIDTGGTKTLIALFSLEGELVKSTKFKTPPLYDDYLKQVRHEAEKFIGDAHIKAVCVAMPGRINRHEGLVEAFGNLDWQNLHVNRDMEAIFNAPCVVENDTKLAGLYAARQEPEELCVYITISTGIGAAVVYKGNLDEALLHSEWGQAVVEYKDEIDKWERIASGKAIKKIYGKLASEIQDEETWREIVRRFAVGLRTVIASVQPEVIIFGGGVGAHFEKFGPLLEAELKQYETPMVKLPRLTMAKNPEEAVVYGGYEELKDTFSHNH